MRAQPGHYAGLRQSPSLVTRSNKPISEHFLRSLELLNLEWFGKGE